MTLQKNVFRVTALVLLVLATVTVNAGDIDKAFKYLNTGDYVNALKYLKEVIAEEPENAAANYAMARYYYAHDNKEHDIELANAYIKRAAKKIPINPEEKAGKKYLTLGVRDFTILTLQKDICQEAYGVAEKANTVEAYQHFIDDYVDEGLVNRATDMRNQLAYIRARAKNSPAALDEFIKLYPKASQIEEAKELYEKILYEQTTADKSHESYKKYIDSYPTGKFRAEAKKKYEVALISYYNAKHSVEYYLEFEKNYKDHPEFNNMQDSIYVLVTKPGTVAAYTDFVRNYTNNRNLKKGWDELYLLYTAVATDSIYINFSYNFKDYPNRDRVIADIELSKKELKPIQQGGKWGYGWLATRDSLVLLIPGEYEEAYEFKSGLAAVRTKPCEERCIYYYIDKNNQRAFKAQFNFAGDFVNGHAIVGVGNCEEEDSCRYGIIDKLGNFVVAPVYNVIEDETEGLLLAAKDGRYGFINARGETVISLKYTDGLPFSEGAAAVALDSNWFFIDKTGRQIVISRFHDVSSFSNGLCAVTQDGVDWGYIDMTGNMVIPAIYESAEDFSGGFGIVSKKEKDPKVKGLTVSQRYKIDKTGKIIEKLTAPKEPAKAKTGKKKKH